MAVWSNTTLASFGENFGRFDAEYYRPEFLETDRILSCVEHVKLRSIASKIDVGHVGPMVCHYSDEGILLLQTQNVRGFFLELEHNIQITPEFHCKLVKSQIRKDDILIARSGSFGAAAIYLEDQVINSADIIIVKLDDQRIEPLYAVTFMNSRHGVAQLTRFASGGVQGHVNLRILENFRLPVLTELTRREVCATVKRAYEAKKASVTAYQTAQKFLESELGLDKLSFQRPVGYTAQFSELNGSQRSDAQHYQPRFAHLLEHLAAFPTRRICEIRTVNRRGLQPIYVEDGSVDVVNSQHLGQRHIDYDGLQKTSKTAFDSSTAGQILNNDLLIYTTGAYIGRTNVFLSKKPALASNHVNILRLVPGIDTAYMALVFQSIVGQFQTQKHARGSAQAELYPADIDHFIVPIVNATKQKVIGDLVRESLVKQQESKKLIYQAKDHVEKLIEEAVRK